jgi:hypothetical protein
MLNHQLKDVKASHTLRWSGGRWYLRRGKWRGGERFVRGRGERVRVKR